MSKRLRASLRANNKGRSLRPKTAQPRVSSSSLPPADPDQVSSELPEERDSQPEAADTSPDLTADSAELGPLGQVREPSNPPPPPLSLSQPPPRESITDLLIKEVVAEVTAASAKSKVPSFKTEEKPAPAPAPAPEKPAAKEEKPVAAAPVAPVAPVAKEKPAPASEKPVASTKEAPVSSAKEAPVASAKAPVSSAKEAPVSSAKDKAAVSSQPASKAAKAAEPASPASKKKPVKATEPAKIEAKPASKRPGEEELDASSVSAQFFRREDDSVPPVIDSHEHEHEHEGADLVPIVPPPSPEVLARRARLRRVVAGVVAFAGVISIAVFGKMIVSGKPTASPVKPPVAQQDTHKDPQPALEPQPSAQKVAEAPKPSNEPAKMEAKPAESAEAKPAETADPKASAAPAEEAKKAEPSGDAEALKKETLSLLNRGRTKDAIAKAREAIAADPADATSYLYLGSALQDSGHWKDGIEAYCDCVRNATKGPISECKQMGGHK